MASGAEAAALGGLTAQSRKLVHALPEVRARAVASLQTKLDAGIADATDLASDAELLRHLLGYFNLEGSPQAPALDLIERLVRDARGPAIRGLAAAGGLRFLQDMKAHSPAASQAPIARLVDALLSLPPDGDAAPPPGGPVANGPAYPAGVGRFASPQPPQSPPVPSPGAPPPPPPTPPGTWAQMMDAPHLERVRSGACPAAAAVLDIALELAAATTAAKGRTAPPPWMLPGVTLKRGDAHYIHVLALRLQDAAAATGAAAAAAAVAVATEVSTSAVVDFPPAALLQHPTLLESMTALLRPPGGAGGSATATAALGALTSLFVAVKAALAESVDPAWVMDHEVARTIVPVPIEHDTGGGDDGTPTADVVVTVPVSSYPPLWSWGDESRMTGGALPPDGSPPPPPPIPVGAAAHLVITAALPLMRDPRTHVALFPLLRAVAPLLPGAPPSPHGPDGDPAPLPPGAAARYRAYLASLSAAVAYLTASADGAVMTPSDPSSDHHAATTAAAGADAGEDPPPDGAAYRVGATAAAVFVPSLLASVPGGQAATLTPTALADRLASLYGDESLAACAHPGMRLALAPLVGAMRPHRAADVTAAIRLRPALAAARALRPTGDRNDDGDDDGDEDAPPGDVIARMTRATEALRYQGGGEAAAAGGRYAAAALAHLAASAVACAEATGPSPAADASSESAGHLLMTLLSHEVTGVRSAAYGALAATVQGLSGEDEGDGHGRGRDAAAAAAAWLLSRPAAVRLLIARGLQEGDTRGSAAATVGALAAGAGPAAITSFMDWSPWIELALGEPSSAAIAGAALAHLARGAAGGGASPPPGVGPHAPLLRALFHKRAWHRRAAARALATAIMTPESPTEADPLASVLPETQPVMTASPGISVTAPLTASSAGDDDTRARAVDELLAVLTSHGLSPGVRAAAAAHLSSALESDGRWAPLLASPSVLDTALTAAGGGGGGGGGAGTAPSPRPTEQTATEAAEVEAAARGERESLAAASLRLLAAITLRSVTARRWLQHKDRITPLLPLLLRPGPGGDAARRPLASLLACLLFDGEAARATPLFVPPPTPCASRAALALPAPFLESYRLPCAVVVLGLAPPTEPQGDDDPSRVRAMVAARKLLGPCRSGAPAMPPSQAVVAVRAAIDRASSAAAAGDPCAAVGASTLQWLHPHSSIPAHLTALAGAKTHGACRVAATRLLHLMSLGPHWASAAGASAWPHALSRYLAAPPASSADVMLWGTAILPLLTTLIASGGCPPTALVFAAFATRDALVPLMHASSWATGTGAIAPPRGGSTLLHPLAGAAAIEAEGGPAAGRTRSVALAALAAVTALVVSVRAHASLQLMSQVTAAMGLSRVVDAVTALYIAPGGAHPPCRRAAVNLCAQLAGAAGDARALAAMGRCGEGAASAVTEPAPEAPLAECAAALTALVAHAGDATAGVGGAAAVAARQAAVSSPVDSSVEYHHLCAAGEAAVTALTVICESQPPGVWGPIWAAVGSPAGPALRSLSSHVRASLRAAVYELVASVATGSPTTGLPTLLTGWTTVAVDAANAALGGDSCPECPAVRAAALRAVTALMTASMAAAAPETDASGHPTWSREWRALGLGSGVSPCPAEDHAWPRILGLATAHPPATLDARGVIVPCASSLPAAAWSALGVMASRSPARVVTLLDSAGGAGWPALMAALAAPVRVVEAAGKLGSSPPQPALWGVSPLTRAAEAARAAGAAADLLCCLTATGSTDSRQTSPLPESVAGGVLSSWAAVATVAATPLAPPAISAGAAAESGMTNHGADSPARWALLRAVESLAAAGVATLGASTDATLQSALHRAPTLAVAAAALLRPGGAAGLGARTAASALLATVLRSTGGAAVTLASGERAVCGAGIPLGALLYDGLWSHHGALQGQVWAAAAAGGGGAAAVVDPHIGAARAAALAALRAVLAQSPAAKRRALDAGAIPALLSTLADARALVIPGHHGATPSAVRSAARGELSAAVGLLKHLLYGGGGGGGEGGATAADDDSESAGDAQGAAAAARTESVTAGLPAALHALWPLAAGPAPAGVGSDGGPSSSFSASPLSGPVVDPQLLSEILGCCANLFAGCDAARRAAARELPSPPGPPRSLVTLLGHLLVKPGTDVAHVRLAAAALQPLAAPSSAACGALLRGPLLPAVVRAAAAAASERDGAKCEPLLQLLVNVGAAPAGARHLLRGPGLGGAVVDVAVTAAGGRHPGAAAAALFLLRNVAYAAEGKANAAVAGGALLPVLLRALEGRTAAGAVGRAYAASALAGLLSNGARVASALRSGGGLPRVLAATEQAALELERASPEADPGHAALLAATGEALRAVLDLLLAGGRPEWPADSPNTTLAEDALV